MTTAAITIESGNTRTAPDSLLEAMHALETAFDAEAQPGEPVTPLATYRSRHRTMPAYRDVVGFVASEEGATVGVAVAEFDRSGDNQHLVEVFVVVAPERRRQGIGRRLLAEVVDAAEVQGCRSLLGFTASSVPSGAAVMQRLGAAEGLVERESELDLAAVDRTLVERWVAEGPERAPGYELLVITDEVPDDLLESYAALYDVSNTAPRDALDVEDSHRTPEQIREAERCSREAGRERLLCLARHRETGELAGWTELGRHPDEWWKVHQFWTAVHPDHRGHALGKWLKAANLAHALERWPEAKKVVTGNAYTNDAMLGINDELGFAETIAWTVWQIPLADVRAHVSGHVAG